MLAEGLRSGDLARLRAIAEEGRQRPLLGGPALIIWGVAIASAALFNWAAVSRTIAVPGWSISGVWFGLTGGAALLAGWANRRHGTSDAVLSTANRVSQSVWRMAGAFLATLVRSDW